ncbi:MAG TPA: hypothetical protein VGQ55_08160 [Pyrinomonadaceae bacterium]|jgi:hypothetical protein|nr:hypothetical protein [Pyrinomonadaceae bacterium]
MKKIYLISIVFLAAAFFTASANAQIKRPVRKPTPKPTPTVALGEVQSAKEKVSNQAFNVTKFTAILGSVASGIETTDRDAKTKKVDRKVLDSNNANKQKLLTAIKGLRQALTDLETEFKTKPSLRRFAPKLDGITALSAQSEDLAYAGKFTASKTPLDTVAQKLRDTLASMP